MLQQFTTGKGPLSNFSNVQHSEGSGVGWKMNDRAPVPSGTDSSKEKWKNLDERESLWMFVDTGLQII